MKSLSLRPDNLLKNVAPVTVVPAQQQRDALNFLVENIFDEEAYDLSPELLAHFNVDKWYGGGGDNGEATWPVHDRILGLQASMLTSVLSPSRLGMVYDNEYRVPEGEDALTMAEIFGTLMSSIYGDLEATDGDWANRSPMISSMRRNRQAEMTDRLIGLSTGRVRMFRPVRTLALHHTRALYKKLGELLEGNVSMDVYSQSHIEDMHERLGNALDIVYTM